MIFASASNHGRNKKSISFPGILGHKIVFCIGAADALGGPTNFSPPHAENLKFSVLGVGVSGLSTGVSDWEQQALPSDQPGSSKRSFSSDRMSGTSFATPIAAGIAALFLDFARPRQICQRGPGLMMDMQKIFLHISSASLNEDYRYLAPWTLVEGLREGEDLRIAIVEILRQPSGCIVVAVC